MHKQPTPLRQRMLDALQMRGYSPRTLKSYTFAVYDLCRHYRRSPEQISAEEVQQWLLHLIKERHASASTCRQYFNGVRFLYVFVLEDKAFADYAFTLPQRQQRLPDLLTREEVKRLITTPANRVHRLWLLSCYGCGLRVSELVHIRVADIDGERRLLHVVQGKGQKDRYVPIPVDLLDQWRAYWQRYRPTDWLFPGRGAEQCLAITTPQKAYLNSKRKAGIRKHGGIHSLRHAFATHALQAGMPVHQLQQILGHKHLNTTMRYIHYLPENPQGGQAVDLIATLGV